MYNIRSFYSLKKRKITTQYGSIYYVNVPYLCINLSVTKKVSYEIY